MSQRNTVEMVQAQTPSLLRRLGAVLYDSLLVGALLLLAMALVVVSLGSLLGWENFDPGRLRGHPLYFAYLCCVPLLFFVWFWTHGGQTLGMRVWRMRVVTADGRPLALRQAVLRLASALLSWATLGLGFLWVLVDPQQLAWHDRLSGTRLVVTRKRPPSRAGVDSTTGA